MMALSSKSVVGIVVFALGVVFGAVSVCSSTGAQTENSVSGTLKGKKSDALVLQLNDGEDLTLPQNGPFVFKKTLAAGEKYLVTVKRQPRNHICEIQNGVGVTGKDPMDNVLVDCRLTGRWYHPASLEDSLSPAGQDAKTVAVAMDGKGNGIMAWSQFDGNNWRIYRAEYRNGQWQKPASLADGMSQAGGDAQDPRLAMAANGDAVIAWEQKVFRDSHISLAERRQGRWRLPTSLEDHISPGASYAWEPDVAMDDSGNTIVVWNQEYSDAEHVLFKSEYRNGAWRHPGSIENHINPRGGDALKPRVVMNNRGDALITWEQDPGGRSQIFMSEYHNGSWSHPKDTLDHINPKSGWRGAYNAMPAMDDSGRAFVSWEQNHGSKLKIYLSEYRRGSWGHPESLVDSISPANSIAARLNSVAMDNGGNGLLIWSLQEKRLQNLYMSEFRNSAWSHPGKDDFFVGPGKNFEFRVFGSAALSDSGKAVVTWQQRGDDGISRAYFVEYGNGRWYFPGEPFNLHDQSAADVSIAASKTGNFIIAWLQEDGSGKVRVYGSVFQTLTD